MKLGVYIHGSSPFYPTTSIEDYIRLAVQYDMVGVHSLWFADHLIRTPDADKSALFEAWSLMAGLSRETNSIKLGTMVTPITFRSFGPLVKMLTTVDHLSNGRLIVGLGAGWQYKEYDMFGIDFPSVSDRMKKLEETLEALQLLQQQDQVDYDGEFIQLSNAYLNPKPIHDTFPILIGGGGEKKTLKLVAKYADYSNFGGDLDTIVHKLDVLENHCEDVGRSFAEITPTTNRAIILGRDQDEVDESVGAYRQRFKEVGRQPPSRENFADTRLVGTPNEVIEQVHQLQDVGIQVINLTVNNRRTEELLVNFFDQF